MSLLLRRYATSVVATITRSPNLNYWQCRYYRRSAKLTTPGIEEILPDSPSSSKQQLQLDHPEPSTKSNVSSDYGSAFEALKPRVIEPESGVYGALGEEISGSKISKEKMFIKLNEFYQLESVRELARSHHIDGTLLTKAYMSFRRYCYSSLTLPPELHVKICDIINGHSHITDLFPFFLNHARAVFPHLECREELRRISDLELPHSWYPEARSKVRKIIYHAGPTNSGKTYQAMNRFLESKSGIYCGPLKLLAVENFLKANDNNRPCDLVTGEERKFANPDGVTRSPHVSCTVEMTQITEHVEVAVIDEIQMIRDANRGWAWTRALLGLPADEVHLCGEEAALDLVKKILEPTGDVLEVRRYKRLTPLTIEDAPLGSLKNIRRGDCIVCFSKEHIFNVSIALEKLGHEVAVIYGTLPPGTKVTQCKRFNKLEECSVMVATDAIGMGLNLSIGRIIFYSLMKTSSDVKNIRSSEFLTTSQCLQIAGRAGRFNTSHNTGYVTTFKPEDHAKLKEIMSNRVAPIERAGLHPTAEQIELFAYHLPHLSLNDLIDLFIDICEFDSDAYFICDMENFKTLAEAINHINVPLRARYIFCCSPINTKSPLSMTMFSKIVRQFSIGEQVTEEWMRRTLGWPLKEPKNVEELSHLEAVYDVLELYLWLSYRFSDIFCEANAVRKLQVALDDIIYSGITNIVRLVKATKDAQLHHLKKKLGHESTLDASKFQHKKAHN